MLSRELFWGIKFGWLTYLMGVLSLAILSCFFYFKIKKWRHGIEEKTSIDWKGMYPRFLRYLLSQRLLGEQKKWGIMHLFIFYGFAILFLGTILLMLDTHLYNFLTDKTFIVYKFILNLSGLFALAGIVVLFLRRYILRPANGENSLQNLLGFVLPFLVLTTGYLVEGSRLAIDPGSNYSWQFWAFPVYPLVIMLQFIGADTLGTVHVVSWWTHMFLSFLTITAMGWTKLSHIIIAPLNMFYQTEQVLGKLRDITISEEYVGADKLSDFTRKQLLSIDACVSAGFCELNCPAFNSNKPLSPRLIMEKLQMVRDYKASLVGEIINKEEIWSCTTCGACQQKCPVLSNPMEKIIDLRRYQVMALGNMPQSWQNALMSIQRRGHPWSGANRTRLDWAKGLNVPLASEKKQFDVLFWVGCTGALVERNIKVTQSVAKLLQRCGIDFAVLGTEENCTCHMVRRAGDEYLFQEMAEKNKLILKQYNFNRIITACPHCYHTLKNEYGLDKDGVQVLSHAVYFKELIGKGLLKIKKEVPGKRITYHDPCYYGRINSIYEEPREICELLGAKLVENEKSRENSFCCGGGGGGIWLDDKAGSRIFETRAKQLLENNIEVIATACPFCITMLESALSYLDTGKMVKVQDISELLTEYILEN
ncbi:Fe-S oxidoreductase [Pelotomaculum thermopropionicum SI]|uniref:Fe-S oxidoreductase n=1 Tax=Pelotomaculum thermopropionicum (strain DSM 13744 / JCM 10971 / SI) TaxID=370438 RepID=A5D203_PELTS|nr:Fe-S oxidoreductase [Pelotomaculum thermopropionicum SI]